MPRLKILARGESSRKGERGNSAPAPAPAPPAPAPAPPAPAPPAPAPPAPAPAPPAPAPAPAPAPISREECADLWKVKMMMARTYMEGERQRLAGMEANLLHYILVFHACDKKHETLSWNVKYEVTVAEFLRSQGVSNQVVDAHMEIVLQARLHQLMALNVCLELWHTISTFQSIVAVTERVLQVGEELLAVMETKEEIHVSAILREMTGQGITSRIPPRMAGHMCVCGEPCFYPIRAWSAASE